jgi:hypothetical protein
MFDAIASLPIPQSVKDFIEGLSVFLASINSCIPEKNFSSTLVTKYVI